MNSHVIREVHTQFPQKINVWAGTLGWLGNHFVGPIFIDQNLAGELYLDMLQNQIYPDKQRIARGNPGEFQNNIVFQQDGAHPHYSRAVREWLNTVFPNRWMGRQRPVE